MSKFKLKDADTKSVVRYRDPERKGMQKVVLKDATQAQLAQLAKLGHKGVVEDKRSGQ